MHKKLLFIVLCIPLLFLAACTSDDRTQKETESNGSKESYAQKGYIVEKNENSIWVIPEIKKEELMGKNQEELDALLHEKYEDKGYNFALDDIDKETISSLHVGQQVVVEYDMIGLSAPISGNAQEIRIVEE